MWCAGHGAVQRRPPTSPHLPLRSGVKAELVGKPSPAFFQAALDSVGAQAGEVAMIGDDANDDCGGALASGLAVATGAPPIPETGSSSAGQKRNDTPGLPNLFSAVSFL